jgi:hypothetical protein
LRAHTHTHTHTHTLTLTLTLTLTQTKTGETKWQVIKTSVQVGGGRLTQARAATDVIDALFLGLLAAEVDTALDRVTRFLFVLGEGTWV